MSGGLSEKSMLIILHVLSHHHIGPEISRLKYSLICYSLLEELAIVVKFSG